MVREAWVEALMLRRARGVGDKVFKALVDAFGSPGAAMRTSPRALQAVEGVSAALASSVCGQAGRGEARREAEAAAGKGFRLIAYGDSEYPALLAQIPDPPSVLYVAGALEPKDGDAVAIVGSRRASSHGVRFARKLAHDLAGERLTVVSGLAQGIDAAAHQGALDAGGRTIAVFGAGLDVIYPGWNAPLANSVRESGAWLSELPLGSEPRAHHFPRRNRIISGLSLGVVVVEAAEKSGSLITAQAALDQGREVFAVPGLPGSYNCRGTHELLRSGAKLVERVEDVLEELRCGERSTGRRCPAQSPAPAGGEAEGIWRALEDAPLHIDEVALRAKVSSAEAAAGLMDLCLKGFAEEWPGKRYRRSQSGTG